jgi:hypothetical protein
MHTAGLRGQILVGFQQSFDLLNERIGIGRLDDDQIEPGLERAVELATV